MKLTLSVIKADIGGFVGHSDSHPAILASANESLNKAKAEGMLIDYYVTKCGDDLQLIMTHKLGVGCEKIHKMAWDTFVKGTEIAKKLKLLRRRTGPSCRCFLGQRQGHGPPVLPRWN
jgi:fructose 1,6-bisphosphate aldolase/phosphatase